MSGLLTRRLSFFLEERNIIPDEQHGFRRGKSTITAARFLLEEIKSSARRKNPLFAVFVDFRAAFDCAPRARVLEKLAAAGVTARTLKLIAAILQANPIHVDDGVVVHGPFCQTTGYAQGDNITPCFSPP